MIEESTNSTAQVCSNVQLLPIDKDANVAGHFWGAQAKGKLIDASPSTISTMDGESLSSIGSPIIVITSTLYALAKDLF